MADRQKYVDANGARLGYEVHDLAKGPPLVFVHGYAMRSTGPAYRELLSLLAGDFTVYALDLRGHGASAGETANWSLATIADDVAAFADALGLQGAVHAGHSLGGFTGLYATMRHPGIFSALCLLATAPASGGGHTPVEVRRLLTERGGDRDAMFDFFSSMYVHADRNAIDQAVDSIGIMDRSVHEAFFSTFPDQVITPRLGEIRIPALVLSGVRDVVVPPAEQHATALGLSFCKEVNFSGEGHMLPLEAAAMTAREIRNFCLCDVNDRFVR
ncbi:MAG: alpha/beta hydrolase [Rhizomicrobium sp.]